MWIEQRKASSRRFVLGVVGLSTLLAAGFLAWNPFALDEEPTPAVTAPLARIDQLLATPAGRDTPPTGPNGTLDSDRLNPASFQLTAASFGDNINYGQAVLFSGCEVHNKSGEELDQDETLSMLMAVDPSGELLKRLRFERTAANLQCQGLDDQDFRRIPELMTMAARQGDPHARAWVLDQRFSRLESGLDASAEGTAEHTVLLAEAQALLPEALSLAEMGNSDAAMVASKVLSATRYGKPNLSESAHWLLVAFQVPDHGFDPRPEFFQDEPYNALSPAEISLATERARQIFLRCCTEPPAEKAGLNPFS